MWAAQDVEGFARTEDWAPGTTEPIPTGAFEEARGLRPSKVRPNFARALAAAGTRDLREEEIALLFTARGTEVEELSAGWWTGSGARGQRRRGHYVVNRNINYTNQCYFRCRNTLYGVPRRTYSAG